MSQADEVVLIDATRRPSGRMDRIAAHTADTPRHLGFSLYLFDHDDRVLVTRRALTKRTWPGVWTNSCCGHPRPDEPVADAVVRRLDEELGLGVTDLHCALPDFGYLARDASGVVEDEWCPTFVGRIASLPDGDGTTEPRPDPDEVLEWAWTPLEDFARAARAAPFAFSPWAVAQVELLAPQPAPGWAAHR